MFSPHSPRLLCRFLILARITHAGATFNASRQCTIHSHRLDFRQTVVDRDRITDRPYGKVIAPQLGLLLSGGAWCLLLSESDPVAPIMNLSAAAYLRRSQILCDHVSRPLYSWVAIAALGIPDYSGRILSPAQTAVWGRPVAAADTLFNPKRDFMTDSAVHPFEVWFSWCYSGPSIVGLGCSEKQSVCGCQLYSVHNNNNTYIIWVQKTVAMQMYSNYSPHTLHITCKLHVCGCRSPLHCYFKVFWTLSSLRMNVCFLSLTVTTAPQIFLGPIRLFAAINLWLSAFPARSRSSFHFVHRRLLWYCSRRPCFMA